MLSFVRGALVTLSLYSWRTKTKTPAIWVSGSLGLYWLRVPFLEFFSFCLLLSSSTVFVFVSFNFIIIIPEKPAYLLLRDRKGADPDGRGSIEKLGGKRGKETIITQYYMKKNFFNKRKQMMCQLQWITMWPVEKVFLGMSEKAFLNEIGTWIWSLNNTYFPFL